MGPSATVRSWRASRHPGRARHRDRHPAIHSGQIITVDGTAGNCSSAKISKEDARLATLAYNLLEVQSWNTYFTPPIPTPWLLPDILAILVSLMVVAFIVKNSRYPVVVLLECFCFVFLYASMFQNFAVVQGWYLYGRSYLMIGDVPFSVPFIEMDVFVTTLWLLEKMDIPNWCKPFIVGLFGMLQDFSIDPVAVRQVFTTRGIATGRWTWLLTPGVVNIDNIPVYNFPGWMLIMLYGSIYILLGRWWFKRSGYKPLVGYVYPFLAFILAMASVASPLASFLLWLAPFGAKGTNAEWIMLAFHLIFPTLLLIFFWHRRSKFIVAFKNDFPVFAVIVLFHLANILFAIAGGFYDVLWLVLLVSAVHITLLGLIVYRSTKSKPAEQTLFVYQPWLKRLLIQSACAAQMSHSGIGHLRAVLVSRLFREARRLP